MAKKIFEDMVKIKREKKAYTFSPSTQKNERVVEKAKQPAKQTVVRTEKVERAETIVRPAPKVVREEPKNFRNEREHLVEDTVSAMGGDAAYQRIRPTNLMWLLAVSSVVFLLFALSFMFSSAKITINPLEKEIAVNKDFYAVLDSVTALPFDLIVMEGENSTEIAAGERTDVVESAKGTVMIYNNYSSQAQPLDINTRLEGSNGKIYKTEKKVIVPGKAQDGTPGSIEVGIYGSEPGESYNSGPLDFNIFGFKGSPKYEKIYARSKGDITGGLQGYLPAISEADKQETINTLKEGLKARLTQKALEQIPSGFILFKDAVFLEVESAGVDVSAKGDKVPVRVKGAIYGFLFEKDKLSKVLAESTLAASEDKSAEVYIPDLENLTFTMFGVPESFRDIKSINFTLSGRVTLVWRVDEGAIAEDMLGRKRKEFPEVLLKYPNIASAHLTLKPVWRKKVPDDLKRVNTVVNYKGE